jgi:hypothetical protein
LEKLFSITPFAGWRNEKKLIVKLKSKSMKKIMILGALAVSVALYSCKDDSDRVDIIDVPGGQTIELSYDFESGDEGWNAGIADIPAGDLDIYGLEVDHTNDPPFESNGALRVAATNPHNEFFVFISKHLTGLEPNTSYKVSFTVDFAASVMVDTTGIVVDTTGIAGDTTGIVGGINDTIGVHVNLNDTLIVKAGATALEPETEADAFDFLRLIFDKGEVGFDGTDMVILGRYSGDTTAGNYVLRTASSEEPFLVTTNEDGELWVIVGSEATGRDFVVYYDSISIEIEE